MPKFDTGTVFDMTPSAISQAMYDSCNRAKLKDLRFHDLRHEAISRFFENSDLDAMEIRLISGHKSLQMLARYSHLRAARLVERLAGAPRGAVSIKAKRGRPRKTLN
jgi:integrase